MANESDFNHLNHKLNQIDLETYEAVFPAPLVQSQLPMHWISAFFYVVQVIKCFSISLGLQPWAVPHERG